MRTRTWLVPILVVLLGAFIAIIGPFLFRLNIPGTWLTAPLQTVKSETGQLEQVYLEGIDLEWQLARNAVYTYRAPGEYVILQHQRFENGATVWDIPSDLNAPQSDDEWTVDFFWPESWGPFPSNARPGTSRIP